jgi:hypothetical protein
MGGKAMRKILKKSIHLKLLKLHRLVGVEIRSRHRFRFSRACNLLEIMSDLIIKRDSWERSGKEK